MCAMGDPPSPPHAKASTTRRDKPPTPPKKNRQQTWGSFFNCSKWGLGKFSKLFGTIYTLVGDMSFMLFYTGGKKCSEMVNVEEKHNTCIVSVCQYLGAYWGGGLEWVDL